MASDVEPSAIADALRYYAVHELGGALHIVLDDKNLETYHVQYCIDNAGMWHREWDLCDPPCGLAPLAIQIGEYLLGLTMSQRRRFYKLLWERL